MNKEEILQRSREENKNGDEYQKEIRERSFKMCFLVGALLLLFWV